MKRNILIIIFIVLLLVGVYLLLLFLQPQKKQVLSPITLPSPAGTQTTTGFRLFEPRTEIKTELPPEIKEKIEKSEAGQVYWARVISLNGNNLNIEVLWFDPINNKINSFPSTLKIENQDEIYRYGLEKNTPQKIKTTINDIKPNDLILVTTLQDKKIISIPFKELSENLKKFQ